MALSNFDVIEVVNLASLLPTDPYRQICEPDEDGHPLPSLEEVLRDIEEAQDP